MHNHQVNVERLLALLCNSLYDGEAGADVLVAGSAVFGAADPAAAVGALASL